MTEQTEQHTPGPWGLQQGRYSLWITAHTAGEGIARVRELNLAEMCGRGPKSQANARLIAAAPELLAVCRKFVALWPIVGGRNVPKATPEVIAVWQAAKAVIDKATN